MVHNDTNASTGNWVAISLKIYGHLLKAHGLAVGDIIMFTNDSGQPGEYYKYIPYYVKEVNSTTAVRLSSTYMGQLFKEQMILIQLTAYKIADYVGDAAFTSY